MTEQNNGEAETRKSLAEGHGITFPNAEEAIEWLKSGMTEQERELTKKIAKIVDGSRCSVCDNCGTAISTDNPDDTAKKILALIVAWQ